MLSTRLSEKVDGQNLCNELFSHLCSPSNLNAIVACWAKHVPRACGSPDLASACMSTMSAICSHPSLELHDNYLQLFDRAPSMRIQLSELDTAAANWISQYIDPSLFTNKQLAGPPYAQTTRLYGFKHTTELEAIYASCSGSRISCKKIFLLAYVLIHVTEIDQLEDRGALRTIETALQHMWIDQDTAAKALLFNKQINLATALKQKSLLQARLSAADYSELFFDQTCKRWRLIPNNVSEEEEESLTPPTGSPNLTFGRMALRNAAVRAKSHQASPSAQMTLSLELQMAKVKRVLAEYDTIFDMATFLVDLSHAVQQSRILGFDLSLFSSLADP